MISFHFIIVEIPISCQISVMVLMWLKNLKELSNKITYNLSPNQKRNCEIQSNKRLKGKTRIQQQQPSGFN